MGRDSNPRYLSVHTLSRRARSTCLAPIRKRAFEFGVDCRCLQPLCNAVKAAPTNHASCFTPHLGRELLRDRLQLCLELSLALIQHFKLQLIAMELDQSVVYLAS